MKIKYSPHAVKRLKQRGISKAEVESVVSAPDALLSADRNRIIARKKLKEKFLEVIYVKENGKTIVITLYYL